MYKDEMKNNLGWNDKYRLIGYKFGYILSYGIDDSNNIGVETVVSRVLFVYIVSHMKQI